MADFRTSSFRYFCLDHRTLSDEEIRKWSITIIYAAITASACLIFSFIYLLFQITSMFIASFATAIALASVPFFGRMGLYAQAKAFGLLVGNISIFFSFQLANGQLRLDLFFVLSAFMPLILFTVEEKKYVALLVVVSLIFALSTPWIRIFDSVSLVVFDPELTVWLNNLVAPITVLIATLPMFGLFSISENYFKMLKLKKAEEIHTSRMNALGMVSAGIAHEINNPLSVISGRCDQVHQQLKVMSSKVNSASIAMTSSELKSMSDATESVKRQVTRITRIINSLKTFSRNSGTELRDFVPFYTIMENCLELVQTRLKDFEITLEYSPNPNVVLYCDETQIMQVVVNLINNAIDALSIVKDSRKRIIAIDSEVDSEVEGDRIIIKVTDNGLGIPSEVLSKIMEPFFTTKPPQQGTGLGLSISRGIIQQHQGTIEITSAPGKTVFTLSLPFKSVTWESKAG